ncbi:cyclic nucleotide-binding-like protein [Phascolomyces articulosus]|uniref:Cyclic nucleotide-binding-like protein n=1 Tax=Phascolomyces articulosus TaxID=60185 RepID=A0AAD5PI09_9FUNG|nr:cyclic nucleotide-binding-like protein [Phascolomyces articulosus]
MFSSTTTTVQSVKTGHPPRWSITTACRYPSKDEGTTTSTLPCAAAMKKENNNEEEQWQQQPRIRRKSITSIPYTMTTKSDDANFLHPMVSPSKSEHQKGIIRCATFDCPIFSNLNPELYQRVLEAMTSGIRVPMGSIIVKQGTPADKFYIVESGTVEEHMNNNAESCYKKGSSFGALSLLHTYSWPASYIATTDDVVLTELSCTTYQSILIRQATQSRYHHRQLVYNTSLFTMLDRDAQHRIVDAMILSKYQNGDVVYREERMERSGRTFTRFMTKGDYFGYIELPNGHNPQRAITGTMTIIAHEPLVCLTIERNALHRLLGK